MFHSVIHIRRDVNANGISLEADRVLSSAYQISFLFPIPFQILFARAIRTATSIAASILVSLATPVPAMSKAVP
jgi:hypothetical protein